MSHTRIAISAFVLALAGMFLLLDPRAQQTTVRGEDKKAEEPKAGEEREFEIAAGVKMKFCWIPAGEAQLGSPEAERDAVLKQWIVKSPVELGKEWLALEAEGKRGKFKTKGFWLGKYTVTQEEWKAVMDDNPSKFQPGGEGKDKLRADEIRDTSRFPVEMLSWTRCQKFLEKVNGRGGVAKVFGKEGKFVLPHEDQWEYACRGGKGNDRAYYWGNELNGTQANCRGDRPFGTETNGPKLGRTCAVEFTNDGKYPKHPWGLCHMNGNVWQWCDKTHEQQSDIYMLRGGSWDVSAYYCRSAFRYTLDQPGYSGYFGFRVCLRLD